MRVFELALLAALTLGGGAAWGQGDEAANRLREALHRTTQQLRDTEDQLSTLQARSAEDARKIENLTAQLAEQTQKAAGSKKGDEAARREVDEAERQMKQRFDAAQAEAQSIVQKWQEAYKQAADTARSRDEAAKKYQAMYGQLTERMATCDTKNVLLLKLGNEILDHYVHRGVVESFAGSEPFVQWKRVQYENLAQDYEDRLRDQKMPPLPENLRN